MILSPRLLFFAIATISCRLLPALETDLVLSQFGHRSWSAADVVALRRLTSIVQTPDGYLWLGGAEGLYKFDGVRFSRVRLHPSAKSEAIRALLRTRDGAVWAASNSALFRVAPGGGAVTQVEGVRGVLSGLMEDRSGALWLSFASDPSGRLARISAGRIEEIEWGSRLPGAPIQAMMEDSSNRLWMGTRDSLCAVERDGRSHCAPVGGGCFALLELARDRLLVSGGQGVHVYSTSPAPPGPEIRRLSDVAPKTLAKAFVRDSTGSLWMGTLGQGVIRTHLGGDGPQDSVTRRQGLSGNLVEAMMEDNAGSIWVLTVGGLDRFQKPVVPRFTALEGLTSDVVTAVFPASNGDVWLGTLGSGAVILRDGNWRPASRATRAAPSTITSFSESSATGMWVGSTSGLHQFRDRQETRTARSRVLDGAYSTAHANGALWLVNRENRLIRLEEGSAFTEPFPHLKQSYRLLAASDGSIWIGHFNGAVNRIYQSRMEQMQAPAPEGGPVQSIFEAPDGGVWVCQASRIRRYASSAWKTWTVREGLPDEVLHAATLGAGRIWVLATNSIVDFGAWDQPGVGAASQFRHEIDLGPPSRATGPRFAADAKGGLWIASDDGVGRFSPASAIRTRTLPVPAIEALAVDDVPRTFAPSRPIEFYGQRVRLEFTALGGRKPEDLQFRYLLEGAQNEWSVAARDRSSSYSNLRPGSYRFCVSVAEANSAAFGEPLCQPFRILPYFYQAWWFAALCLTTIFALLVAAYRYRLVQIKRRYELVLDERLRVGRDLHDTVLQGFSGVSFQLEAASRLLDIDLAKCREVLNRAMQQSDQSLAEAREMIGYLRVSIIEGGFEGALGRLGEELFDEGAARFEMHFDPKLGPLSKEVEKLCYLATREAVRNAARHSRAKLVSLRIARNPHGLEVIVRDDGQGFDLEAAAAKGRWGINGMMERCASVGGKCAIRTKPGQGTDVRIYFPHNRL